MFSHSLRAARPLCARLTAISTRRNLITPSSHRAADLVQDMYLRELKSYKPAPLKPTDSEGQVQKFCIPKSPSSPEEVDLADAAQLKSYETQAVEVEGSSGEGAEPVNEDWFEEEEEEVTPAAAH